MDDIKRYDSCTDTGLTEEQVRQRIEAGLTNEYKSNTTKSYGQILKEHFLTFYNILNIVLCGLLMSVGAYKDLAFAVIVVANFLIGVIQEFSSKRTLDKLSLIVAAKVSVIRDGQKQTVQIGEVVLDDVMELKAGNQVCADGTVLTGYLEVNESLISGESDVIIKREGDFLYSGSFVVSGTARARAEKIGAENYANQISASAKEYKKRSSELYRAQNKILKFISYILVPMGIMLFLKQYLLVGLIPEDAIVKTVAALIGMIPEGLILMTSIAFVTSVIFLARDNTLVQEVYGIETLARADIICLDKTGTLTEGELLFEKMIPLGDVDAERIMRLVCGASQDENATMTSLKKEFPPLIEYKISKLIPFSSERKYSGVCFEGQGTYILGAAEFIFPASNDALKVRTKELSKDGSRVLIVAHSEHVAEENALPEAMQPLAILILSDKIRPDVKDTLAYFYEYDVDIKIISGDHPSTVAKIAGEAGVKNAENCVDVSGLQSESELKEAVLTSSVFGRVSPAQKKEMVEIMKQQGSKVAMMGDGVNDVLALKEANCSVAVASGSDAAKNVSDIVLMDSNLKHLLHVVEDGRKIINNIQRVATLFITKTVYSVLLAFLTLFIFESAYPFTPVQLVITSFITIGAPSFFLALEPQYDRIKGQFIKNVLQKSLPGGLAVTLCIIIVNILMETLVMTPNQLSTICVLVVVAGGMWVLLKVSVPFTTLRKVIIIAMIALFAGGAWLMSGFFELYPLTIEQIILTAALCGAMFFIMRFFEWLMKKIYAFMDKRELEKSKMVKKLKSLGK